MPGGPGARAGREPAPDPRPRNSPSPLDRGPHRVFFLPEMTVSSLLDTDLLTPLGAYLHLREHGRASFLLESVEQGRLGRYSLVGCGSRLLSYEEAEQARRAGRRLPRLRLRLEARADRADARRRARAAGEPLRRRRRARPVRPRAAASPRCSAAIRARSTALLESDVPRPPRESGARAETRRFPSQADYERGVVACKDYIRQGDAFQIVLSQRAERRTGVSALALYRSLRDTSTPRRTSSCSSSTGSRSSARRPRRSSSATGRAHR